MWYVCSAQASEAVIFHNDGDLRLFYQGTKSFDPSSYYPQLLGFDDQPIKEDASLYLGCERGGDIDFFSNQSFFDDESRIDGGAQCHFIFRIYRGSVKSLQPQAKCGFQPEKIYDYIENSTSVHRLVTLQKIPNNHLLIIIDIIDNSPLCTFIPISEGAGVTMTSSVEPVFRAAIAWGALKPPEFSGRFDDAFYGLVKWGLGEPDHVADQVLSLTHKTMEELIINQIRTKDSSPLTLKDKDAVLLADSVLAYVYDGWHKPNPKEIKVDHWGKERTALAIFKDTLLRVKNKQHFGGQGLQSQAAALKTGQKNAAKVPRLTVKSVSTGSGKHRQAGHAVYSKLNQGAADVSAREMTVMQRVKHASIAKNRKCPKDMSMIKHSHGGAYNQGFKNFGNTCFVASMFQGLGGLFKHHQESRGAEQIPGTEALSMLREAGVTYPALAQQLSRSPEQFMTAHPEIKVEEMVRARTKLMNDFANVCKVTGRKTTEERAVKTPNVLLESFLNSYLEYSRSTGNSTGLEVLSKKKGEGSKLVCSEIRQQDPQEILGDIVNIFGWNTQKETSLNLISRMRVYKKNTCVLVGEKVVDNKDLSFILSVPVDGKGVKSIDKYIADLFHAERMEETEYPTDWVMKKLNISKGQINSYYVTKQFEAVYTDTPPDTLCLQLKVFDKNSKEQSKLTILFYKWLVAIR